MNFSARITGWEKLGRCPVVLGLLRTHGGQRQPGGANHQSGLVVRAVLWGGAVQAAWAHGAGGCGSGAKS